MRQSSLTLIASVILGLLVPLKAQIYIAGFDGVSASSTFEGYTGSLPLDGWTVLSGSPRFFDATNDALINGAGAGFSPYGVQYITAAGFLPNAAYTLSFRMGYFSAPNIGNAEYSFELGSWTNDEFVSLDMVGGGPVAYTAAFSANGSNGIVRSLVFETGSLAPIGQIAIRWEQTNLSTGADFFGFDNVVLSYVPIPEPATATLFVSAAVLGVAGFRRSSKNKLTRVKE